MENILIFGAGGHAKVVIDIVEKGSQYKIAALLDKSLQSNATICGYPVFEEQAFKTHPCQRGVIAVGDNWSRYQIERKILQAFPKFEFVTLVHPSAVIGRNVTLGVGTVVMAGTIINCESKIGSHCIINTASSLDHDNVMMDFSSVAPGSVLGGRTTLGKFSAVSLGASVIHGIKIGEHSVIGAGSTVLHNIPDNVLAYGVPCKVIRTRSKNDSYL